MFKTAPRYLSGVSVFYGDDITRREIDGEVVMIVGPAFQGPSVPLTLKSIDNAISIYGPDNPLTKSAYQFWDGYSDSAQTSNLRIVTMRVGGIPASLTTSYGLSLQTVDAYDGIENDFYIYVDNTSAKNLKVKLWDKNKQIVFDSQNGINAGHITVKQMPTGNGGTGAVYGKDLDNDPLALPVSLADIVKTDLVNPTGNTLVPKNAISLSATTLEIVPDVDDNLIPQTGTLRIYGVSGNVANLAYVNYTAYNASTNTFTLDSAIGAPVGLSGIPASNVSIALVGSVLTPGDSELVLAEKNGVTGKQRLYEKMRNALLELEQFTPDYIVPAGVSYNDTETYIKSSSGNSLVAEVVPSAATGTPQNFVVLDAAATWPTAGTVTLFDGTTEDVLSYSSISLVDGENYRLGVELPVFALSPALKDNTVITVSQVNGGAPVSALNGKGYIKIDSAVYAYTASATVEGELTISPMLVADTVATTAQKVIGEIKASSATGTFRKVGSVTATTNWQETTNHVLGIGYVKEIDKGDHYEFTWSDTKIAGHNIAHFGYLFANFCNEAAVGYNTPLCGMNVDVSAPKAAGFDRPSIVKWIGNFPETRIVAGTADAVEAVTRDGKGLLGDPTLVGSTAYNRTSLSDKANNKFADAAYGLLLTDEGFVDGHIIKDTFYNVVDLGKFLCVGAGLLTFNHRASGTPYIDSCGAYSLGLLAGTAKNEGISFKRIGTNSNATVGVVVHRKLYNDLANLGYIVVTREKGLGWVINNDNSVARNDSGYYLISTTRTIKAVVEGKRSVLVSFIGKPSNKYYFEAARTKITDSFRTDMANGYLNGYTFDLQVAITARAIGKLYLRCSLNPPLEVVQVDIDTVIDRNVTAGA